MRYLLIFLLLFTQNAYAVTFTPNQKKHLYLIHQEIKKKHPSFVGFDGDSHGFVARGLDENTAQYEIDNIDLQAVLSADIDRQRKRAVRNKLKSLGFTDNELKAFKNLQED